MDTENTYRKVAIISDSAAALPWEVLDKHCIFTAHMDITVGGETLKDGQEDIGSFYEKLQNTDLPVTTSAPMPGEWLKAFKDASKVANSLFCVTVSGELSASLESAKTAARMAKEEGLPLDIQVFDSKTAAGSQALIVLELARLAKKGASPDEVKAAALNISEKVRLIAVIDTLEYLHRGGRVIRPAVWVSNFLNIKPIMELYRGRTRSVGRFISRKRAVRALIRYTLQGTAERPAHVNIMHAACKEDALYIKEAIGSSVNLQECILTEFHPFMGAHTGPGLVGVSYYTD